MRISIVIFAQIPPPEHGQSRMVMLALETLRDKPESFDVHHVNARFSNSLEEIGESSIGKMLLTAKYLFQAICVRFLVKNPILYYVPGPVKWSSVLRDWALLSVLRLFYSRVVFHWHAIGHGEWAQGSERLTLGGPRWMDCMARKISAWVLNRPFASISVSSNSRKDAIAVASKHEWVICNGIEDPCPGFNKDLATIRESRHKELATTETLCFKILFLSHGTLEKGITDALDCLSDLLDSCDTSWRFQVTLAGGVSDSISIQFDTMVNALLAKSNGRIEIIKKCYLTGNEKHRCFIDHDIFLAPSRWESFGLTVIEAMAYGLPIVAAASDGVKGVLPDGYPYLAPVADPKILAEKLRSCCQNLRDRPTEDEKWTLRESFLSNYQIKDFRENLTNVFLAFQSSSSSEEDHGSKIVDSSSENPDTPIRVHSRPFAVEPSSSSSEDDHGSKIVDSRSKNPTQSGTEEPVLQLPSAQCFSESVIEERKSQCVTTDPFSPTETPKHRNTEESVLQLPSAQCFSEPVIEKRTNPCVASNPFSPTETPSSSASLCDLAVQSSSPISNLQSPISLSVYLADQNPGHDRSYGISRMSQVVLDTLQAGGHVNIETISSKTSQQGSDLMESARVLPWGTRRKWVRLLTDHFHPLFHRCATPSDVYYFPKGYLPLIDVFCHPSVVTIHDTIIQYDKDHYPEWRSRWEYTYWSMMLKHTLRKANRILTVSESSKIQVQIFMDRHRIPRKEITVTYEPCLYESFPQPENPTKENYVIHLASCEPHKRTAHLIRWWYEAEKSGRTIPMLHLIGQIPPEVTHLLASSHSMAKHPFLEDAALQASYQEARALILPSEIEGFGLPALEAYYLGTPVCYVKDTSVEEVLCPATHKGGFSLDSAESLFTALDEVMSMSPEEIRECGLKLRETYAAEKVAERMLSVFHEVSKR